MGSVSDRKGFLIYEEMRKYLTIQYMRRPLVIYMTLQPIPSKFDFFNQCTFKCVKNQPYLKLLYDQNSRNKI
jgi:hypothetical protein